MLGGLSPINYLFGQQACPPQKQIAVMPFSITFQPSRERHRQVVVKPAARGDEHPSIQDEKAGNGGSCWCEFGLILNTKNKESWCKYGVVWIPNFLFPMNVCFFRDPS